jgi:hypothetical protein
VERTTLHISRDRPLSALRKNTCGSALRLMTNMAKRTVTLTCEDGEACSGPRWRHLQQPRHALISTRASSFTRLKEFSPARTRTTGRRIAARASVGQ